MYLCWWPHLRRQLQLLLLLVGAVFGVLVLYLVTGVPCWWPHLRRQLLLLLVLLLVLLLIGAVFGVAAAAAAVLCPGRPPLVLAVRVILRRGRRLPLVSGTDRDTPLIKGYTIMCGI